MAAPNSSTSNQEQHNSDATPRHVVDPKFCLNSPTTFVVKKKPEVISIVGGRWIIQDPQDQEKFELEELAPIEPGLALKDSDRNLILTVKPEDTMLDMILDFFGTSLQWKVKKQWNVFRTMEPPGRMETLFTVDISGVNWTIEVPRTDYKFEGSFENRIFTIFDISRGISQSPIIAAKVELKYKAGDIKIDSVYDVTVEPGYDQAFIFGLVAVFEQIRLNIH